MLVLAACFWLLAGLANTGIPVLSRGDGETGIEIPMAPDRIVVFEPQPNRIHQVVAGRTARVLAVLLQDMIQAHDTLGIVLDLPAETRSTLRLHLAPEYAIYDGIDAPFGPSAPTLVDVDGDDDLDLFVGTGYGKGRVLACEILTVNPRAAEIILDGALAGKARVLVGLDAHVIHHFAKLAGARYQDVVARVTSRMPLR